MVRRNTRIPLNVYLNSRLVGRLERASSGAISFQYDTSWLDWEHGLPISLSLPLGTERFTGDRVLAVFDNLLPDNDAIRRQVAERTGANGADAYSLLATIGRDCVGALQFLPDGQEPGDSGVISGRAVKPEEVANIIRNLARAPLGMSDDDEFRISIAGAQEKTALLWWKDKWHIPHGTTATTHILKPSIGKLKNEIDLSLSVENEHLCLTLCRALELPAAETTIETFDGVKVLSVKRFDRLWSSDGKRLLRVPQEDCCQALSYPPTKKYETEQGPGLRHIMKLVAASDEPTEDQKTLLKAQMVYWLLGATDGHAKNFSIWLYPEGRFRLAPLYDVMSAQPNVDAGQIRHNKMKLAMSVGKNRHYGVDSIAPRHFIQTVKECGLPEGQAEKLFAEILELAPKAIEKTLSDLPAGFPEQLTNSIVGGFRHRLSALEHATEGS